MHDVKKQLEGLHPTMRPFGRNPAIRLVELLSTMRDYFDIICARETADVSVLTYLLEGEARDVQMEQMEETEGEVEPGETMVGT